MPAPSPLNISGATPKFIITVERKPIPDAYSVFSINVSLEVNRISSAKIIFEDGDMQTADFPVSNSADLVPGNEIEISAAYGDEDAVSIFKGVIVKQAINVSSVNGSMLTVTCKHKAVQLTYVRKEEAYAAMKDSDIMAAIIAGYGIPATIKNSSVMQELVFQKLATDWDFILSRVDFYGYIITLNGDTITIGEPGVTGAAVLRVAYGDSMIEFNAELNAENQAANVSASAWDIKNQALITAYASEPTVNAQGNISAKQVSGALKHDRLNLSSGTPMSPDELQAWADGALLKMRLSSIRGEVSFQGSSLVRPGTLIELAGVGDRFNGNAFVTAVNHVIEGGNWISNVTFGLDNIPVAETFDISYPPAAGQLPAIHGLQVATVKKIEDAEGEFRILVEIPSNASNETGIWARMATFYASSGVGASFIPEIGDEVIVGFLESNPRYPVVLGSMYSSAHTNPVTPADKNNIKSIVTRSKLKISFDDDKKIVKVETPGGNSFTLNDDTKSIHVVDQNKNTLKMTAAGIEISSTTDINIKASGNISLNAKGKLDLEAAQDATITGMNVNHTAEVGFTAKGNATAELSASGQTTVKGGIVMIN